MTSFISAISISLFVQKIDPPIAGSSMPDYTLRLLLSTLFHTFSTFSCCVSLNFSYREFLDALASLKTMFKIKSVINVFKRVQSIREYCRAVQSITECYRVLQSITACYRVLQSAKECYRVLQSVTECYRVLQSITECYTM